MSRIGRTSPSSTLPCLLIYGWLVFAHPIPIQAQVPLPQAKPIPRMQVVPQPYDQAAVLRDGVEITRYHFGKDLYRPFLFPLIGPSGHSLTRMGHPRDPNGHSHHNSVWISHHDVNGVGFWNDQGKGRIVHRRVVRYEDMESEAIIEVVNGWVDENGKTLLEETRRMRIVPLEKSEWLLLFDLRFQPKQGPVTFGKTPFGIIGVRMAKTIGVKDGGGLIRNSAGGENEAGVFWKKAKWMDYSGPISRDAAAGITLFDHPTNPNHPSVFHVRDDGWMGAALTHEQPLELKPEQTLQLRYGLYLHAGVPTSDTLTERFLKFVAWPEPMLEQK